MTVARAVEAVGWPIFAGGLVASALGSGASVGSAGITGTAVALLIGAVGVALGGGSVGPGAGAGTGVTGDGVSVGLGVGAGAGRLGVGTLRLGVVFGVSLGAGVGSGASGGIGVAAGVAVSAGELVGSGLIVGVATGTSISGTGIVAVANGAAVAAGITSHAFRSAAAGSTRTTTWSLSEAALSALIVTRLVQVPAALARNVTCLTPLAPGASVPIASVNPSGVKHPPLAASLRTTPVAGSVPLLP